MNEKQKLLAVIGPTAVGKTNLSIQLAKKYNGEIISGDSMQIYKTMDIGTAKISPAEMEGIPHYLIDIKEPDEAFSAAEFQQLVRRQIEDISSRGKLPIIVGGTGLYIQSVIYDYQFSDAPSDEEFRKKLEKRAEIEGSEVLFAELEKMDPTSAENIHPNNVRRVIRALEVYHCTGIPVSQWQEKQQPELLYNTSIIGLTMDRDLLYQRINERVDLMMRAGLLKEVESLYEKGIRNCPSIQAIGYKEIYDYIEGRATLETAIENLKQNSRRYAKRQLTWFRNKMDVEWFDMTKALEEEQRQKKFAEICFHIEGKLRVKSNTYY
ncbi:tRNA (adenosine(37)-N6)-dimethylallyltransferase MiaA [Cytobacillus gottheilii]|uniref:tRNA (adenosine(37)-N6)-dimethylallyltransferase MiaA n=1 Tax=Cytobacillus gottheilii TaxID=859144 RepID=UPI0009BAFB54|nr:tRNA (adenosine(37)-N6)-dimethylallyltransferase MiaA [Cytobacillus gottheilii]